MKRNVLLVFLFCCCLCSIAQTSEVRQKHFNVRKNIALEGYDPVSYFAGAPTEGSTQFKHEYQGVTYLFNSRSNLSKFKANPEKYEPAYGGWCAFAMGETAEKVKIDPDTYKILDGKLYLFYNFWGNNTLEGWNERETKLKEQADLNWRRNIR
jgi:YHS domain-containing protein